MYGDFVALRIYGNYIPFYPFYIFMIIKNFKNLRIYSAHPELTKIIRAGNQKMPAFSSQILYEFPVML